MRTPFGLSILNSGLHVQYNAMVGCILAEATRITTHATPQLLERILFVLLLLTDQQHAILTLYCIPLYRERHFEGACV